MVRSSGCTTRPARIASRTPPLSWPGAPVQATGRRLQGFHARQRRLDGGREDFVNLMLYGRLAQSSSEGRVVGERHPFRGLSDRKDLDNVIWRLLNT